MLEKVPKHKKDPQFIKFPIHIRLRNLFLIKWYRKLIMKLMVYVKFTI